MKIITATLASLSLAIGLAAPTSASASDEDIAKIIAGIATIAIIAKIADNRRDRDRAAAAAVERDRFTGGRLGSRDTHWGRIDRDRRHGSNANRGFKRLPLPHACARSVETRRGDRTVYGARCLNRNFRHANKLPQSCQTVVETRRGDRLAYSARCLRRDGWQVARR